MDLRLRTATAEEVLRTYGLSSLVQMVRQQGVHADDKKKGALVRHLATKLYDPPRVMAEVRDLKADERRVLDELILSDGQAMTVVLRRGVQARWNLEHPASEKELAAQFDRVVARLGKRGLVFTLDVRSYQQTVEVSKPGQYLYIPNAILEQLPPAFLPVKRRHAPPVQMAANREALFRDLYVLLAFAQEAPIPLSTRGLLPKRTFVQIDAAFQLSENRADAKAETDLGRLPFLRALAEDLGLLSAGALGLQLGEQTVPFLSRPRGQRLRQLYDAYRRTERWSELSRLPDVNVTPRAGVYHPDVIRARLRVLAEIGKMPPGEWISVDHLVERLKRTAYEFLLSRTTAHGYYYGYGTSVSYEPNAYLNANSLEVSFVGKDGDAADWETVEAAFIRIVLTEALFWLGIVDLGVETELDEPSGFRLTPEGAAVLRGEVPPSVQPKANVVIQPNFQVFAFEPTGEDVLFTLDRLAQRVRAEQVVEYRLTRDSVYSAQRAGMEIGAIIAFLERVSAKPLPQNVRRSLEDWGALLDRIVVRRGVALIQTIDESTLDALDANPEMGQLLERRISPTAALVSPANLEAIRCGLVESADAPLPALSEGNDATTMPAVKISPDGHIGFQQRQPSVYLRYFLRFAADELEDGEMRLTPASLLRIARKGLPPDEIIARLRRLNSGPLPEDIPPLVQRWAKDWGNGALAEVVLLRVESEDIMANLMADPELKAYLQPLAGAPRFASIRPNSAEQVRKSLRERGMGLADRF